MKKIIITVFGVIIIVFIIWFYHYNFSFKKYTKLNKTKALEFIENATQDSVENLEFLPLVKDEETAIAIAEPILFNIYGKSEILMERPYNICLVNNDWVIIGTFPRIGTLFGASGGTFEMIINSKNAEVKSITHGK